MTNYSDFQIDTLTKGDSKGSPLVVILSYCVVFYQI